MHLAVLKPAESSSEIGSLKVKVNELPHVLSKKVSNEND